MVLDVGCGALRGGYWIMRVLDPGHYCGIEPNVAMLDAGLERIVEPEVVERAAPRFDRNDGFDFGVFGAMFDFVIARSIWTHASKPQIETMLDSFVAVAAPDGVFLTSVLPVSEERPDYTGDAWVGRSHESDEPGTVAHSMEWIEHAAAQRRLVVRTTGPNVLRQQWLALRRVDEG
jgi:ubiquinone/menaquinone biosynthesis C-methylase UbiE